MIVIGIGWGLAFPALNVQATTSVAPEEQGLAAGLFNTSFQIGGAILLAVVSAVISSHTSAGGNEASSILASIRPGIAILIPVAMAGVLVIALARSRAAVVINAATEADVDTTALAQGAESL
jgi:MFS family permease